MSKIIIRNGALRDAGSIAAQHIKPGTAAIITDDTVDALYGDALEKSLRDAGWRVARHTFKHGEASKNIETYASMLYFLADSHLTRTDTVFALGGGVTGDMAGFAAATYLRGVHLVQVPTTLLACVDSSVGGKTALDLPQGKNLVGAFYQSDVVIIDPETLSTLPADVYRDGMAEVVKYAAILDAEILDRLDDLPYIIKRCVELKEDVVSHDERDTGLRQILNFGHTFGHGVEKCSNFAITHGQGVATGMAIMARACAKRGLCTRECADKLIAAIAALGLPVSTDFAPDALFSAMLSDKKRAGDAITLVTLWEIGKCDLYKTDLATARAFLEEGMTP